jgi:hypothetical protein
VIGAELADDLHRAAGVLRTAEGIDKTTAGTRL